RMMIYEVSIENSAGGITLLF
ncbi:hypothetical protein BMETH_13581642254, partial [methanotrophic bacterial endosymbiont of Bathymodiolus sp.]